MARVPNALITLFRSVQSGILNPVVVIVVLAMFAVVVALVVFEQRGQRKIPVQYAKRVVGRKMYGSQSSYIPFKITPPESSPSFLLQLFSRSRCRLHPVWVLR